MNGISPGDLDPFINEVSTKSKRDFVVTERQETVGLRLSNIELYLSNRRSVLGEVNFNLLWSFKDYLRSEGQSTWSVYTAVYRVTQLALFLKEFGKDLSSPTPQLIRLFLSTRGHRENIRRYSAAIKKFYKFMKECYDESYEKIYKSFKVPSFKIDNYPLPSLPSEHEVLLLINHAKQPYKSILALAYECGLRRSEILLLKIKDVIVMMVPWYTFGYPSIPLVMVLSI